jgi:hypothetical protein
VRGSGESVNQLQSIFMEAVDVAKRVAILPHDSSKPKKDNDSANRASNCSPLHEIALMSSDVNSSFDAFQLNLSNTSSDLSSFSARLSGK